MVINKSESMENDRRSDYQSPKGITLIALVVTIIVLLILAGIAINLTVGNNGLFSRTKNAANTWRKAEYNELDEMQSFANTYDTTLNNLELDKSEEDNKIIMDKITGQEKTNTETTDKNGNRVVIPAGFKVINPDQTVNEGIVIEDASANNDDTVGNQFVWVPCGVDGSNNTLKYDRYAYARDDWKFRQTKLNEKDEDGSYKIQRADDTSYYFHEAISEQERISIQKYGGYYIGRYEVGCDTARTSHTTTSEIGKIQSGLNAYNWVTRDEAKNLAERIYTGKSRLCSSYAWDTALQFIGGTYAVESTGDNNKTTSSTTKLENTGYHAMKNIYDMGGNVGEWTTETYNNTGSPYVLRGGDYGSTALDVPACYRSFSNNNSYYGHIRF